MSRWEPCFAKALPAREEYDKVLLITREVDSWHSLFLTSDYSKCNGVDSSKNVREYRAEEAGSS